MYKSHCIYCESEYFGLGCLYSPTHTHVHMSPTGCMYCGNTSLGGGCIYNPYGSIHVRGPEFLNKTSTQAESTVLLNYLISKIKEPTTKEGYKSPLDRFYKRLVGIISHSSEPLLETLILQESSNIKEKTKENFLESYNFKKNLQVKLEQVEDLIKEASLILPPEMVEEAIIDAIIE